MEPSKREQFDIDEGRRVKKQHGTSRQYFAVFWMNCLSFAYGSASGWASGALLILNSLETPLKTGPLNVDEVGWIASGIGIGGFIANLFLGWLSERCGRKIALYVIVVPQILSWLIIYFAQTPFHLIMSRILAGFAGGGTFILIPLFTTEISDDSIRGFLGSLLVLVCNCGMLFAYICGGYLDYYTIPLVMVLFSAAFVVLFIRYPDTPVSLMKRSRFEEAEQSFLFYKSIDAYSSETKSLFEDYMKSAHDDGDNKVTLKDFDTKASKKAIIYGMILMALNQFCGCFALITYSATIFQKSGSNLSPIDSSIVVGFIQILGGICASLFVERAGRKIMMSTSSFGTFIGLSGLGFYLWLQSNGVDVENFNFIPLVTFSFTIFLANLGILTLPFMILNEISPPKIRGFTSIFCMSFLWIFVFCAIKYLPALIESLGLHGAIFIFAFNSLLGGFFILMCIPETKGKSIEEIIRILEK